MTSWDERFRTGSYPQDPDPSPVLRDYVDEIPDGRALDLATGTGRNAVFLAEQSYEVDAVDQSREGLDVTMENAEAAGVADRVEPVQADLETYGFPDGEYDVVTVSFYRIVDRLPEVKAAIADGGWLFYEHHLRSVEETPSGPSSDRYRFAANELLRCCLDLTVLYYDESTEERPSDQRRACARILARKTTGPRQTYPRRPE